MRWAPSRGSVVASHSKTTSLFALTTWFWGSVWIIVRSESVKQTFGMPIKYMYNPYYAWIKKVTKDFDNSLSSVPRQAIIWTNADLVSNGLSEILIMIRTFSLKKMRLVDRCQPYISHWWPGLLKHICVTRSRWVHNIDEWTTSLLELLQYGICLWIFLKTQIFKNSYAFNLFSAAKSFCNFAHCMAVILPCYNQIRLDNWSRYFGWTLLYEIWL